MWGWWWGYWGWDEELKFKLQISNNILNNKFQTLMDGDLKLKNKRVTVMGLGLHGGAVGTVKWLCKQGAEVLVTDLKGEEELKESIEKLDNLKGVSFVLGKHREKDFIATDLVVRNPGVPRDSKYLEITRRAGVDIEMDSSLFFKHCASRDIIGITGSKGKTTTARVIAHLLSGVSKKVVIVGVDGVSPLNELKNIAVDTTVVFELSSWRLEALDEQKISPSTAVVTSLYPDHLNTYKSFESYIEVKKAIVRYQGKGDAAVLNYDDELVQKWALEIKGKLYWYSLNSVLLEGAGIYVDGSEVKIKRNGEVNSLFSASELSALNNHMARNVLPAVLLAEIRGMKFNEISSLLGSMKTMPHRLEHVRKVRGVTYVNDTTATIPEATIAALKSFSNRKIVLILGGSDKGLNYGELAQKINRLDVKAIIFLPGNASARISQEIGEISAPIFKVGNMEEAVEQASSVAEKGEVVLLSPAAASFGLFKHEFDRGDQFKETVNKL